MVREKEYEDMNIEELSIEMVRNNRLVSLCINLPVVYESNVELTETKWEVYKRSCGNYADFARNMVADNIRIEDIANKLNLDKQSLLDLLIKYNWIQNVNDFYDCKSCYWFDGFKGECIITLCSYKAGTGHAIDQHDFHRAEDNNIHAQNIRKYKEWKAEANLVRRKYSEIIEKKEA